MINKYRLRYAPSPTGYLHIGNARTALFNFLLSKHNNGNFIVRIEDTDTKRNVSDAIDKQFEDLNWLGIKPDESMMNPGRFGPYKQLDRLETYKSYAETLISYKKAFYCFCDSEELEKERNYQKEQNIKAPKYSGKCLNLSHNEIEILKNEKEYSIRFRVTPDTTYKYKDMIRDEISFDSNDIGDFVIIKKNNIPTYNFAVVVDDHLMHISHVLRGEEHISNTPKQLMIYEAFKWNPPIFGHLTLIVNDNRKKLSKRDKDVMTFINQYKEKGYLPEAMVNFISLLGWSPKSEQEFFSIEELIKIFDETGFSKSPGMFDVKKLNWMNSKLIKKMPDDEYFKLCNQFLDKKFNLENKDKKTIFDIVKLFKSEIQYGEEIIKYTSIFLDDNYIFDKKYKELFFENNYNIKLSKFIFKTFLELDVWTKENINSIIKKAASKFNLKGKDLFMPIRILTTNSDHGPSLADCIYLLGKEKVLKNVKYILSSY